MEEVPSNTEDSNSIKAKKWLKERTRAKYIAVGQFFLFGAEFSLVSTTLPFYFEELHTSNIPVYFGCAVFAYCFSSTISGLVFGRIADLTLQYKLVVISSNTIALLGNVLYIMGYSPYLILFARFLNGFLDAMYSATYGELARCYTAQEFPRHGGHLQTAYCVGLSISPGFNLMPSDFVLDLKFVTIRYTNAPGAILFLLVLVQTIICCFYLTNVSLNKQRNEIDIHTLFELQSPTVASSEACYRRLETSEPVCDKPKELATAKTIKVSSRSWWEVVLELITKREILILLYAQTIWAYCLISGNVLVPFVSIKYLQFSHEKVAFFYIGCGVSTSIVMFLSSRLIAMYGSARTSLTAFLLNFLGTLFLYLIVLAYHLPFPIRLVFLIVFGFSHFLSAFLNSVSIKVTLSKHVVMEDQSFSQGVFSFVEQVASIFAALTGGFAFEVVTWYCLWTVGLLSFAIFIISAFYVELEYPLSDADDEALGNV